MKEGNVPNSNETNKQWMKIEWNKLFENIRYSNLDGKKTFQIGMKWTSYSQWLEKWNVNGGKMFQIGMKVIIKSLNRTKLEQHQNHGCCCGIIYGV